MDPKYLGKNQQDSSRIPHSISPGYYYFAEQARGAGYMDPEFRRHQHGYVRNDYFHHHPHHPQDMHEAIRREIEKERIREEIIMSEIVRRRVLEAEVRRELMMEKEMALRRGKDGFPSGSSPVMGLESPIKPSFSVTRAEGWPAEERLGMSLEDREKLKGRIENGGSKTSPFQTGATDLRISEVKTASKGNKEKERILLLTKPDENVSGSKRKAVTPPEVVNIELPANVIGNKKSKEEWSCALCEVSATSEKGLNDHLLGKKHKSKEAALRAQRAGKNYSIGLFPKKAIRSNPVVWTIDPEEEEGVKLEAQSLFYEKAGKATTKDDLPLLENPKSELLKITQAEVIQKVHENEDDPMKKGFKFWCEMCHVGTLSRKVMNTHKWGKKHVSRLRRQREQNGGTGSFNQKKSVVLVDPVKEVSENGKIENLEKFNKALDEASSEDHTLLDVVKHEEQEGSENINKAFDEVSSEDHTILDVIKHEEQEGKTLNSENINKALDEERSMDHELLDAVEHDDNKRVDIIMEEDIREWILPSEKLVISVPSCVGKTKPDENVLGSKRKDVTTTEVVNIELPPDVITNKKSKEEWSCALCQVSATSEKGLTEHVLEKKHKSKEAALRAQRAGDNCSIGHLPKKAIKANPVVGTIDPGEEEGVKLVAQSLFSEKVGRATSEDDLPLSENPKAEHLKKTQAEVVQKVHNEDDPKKKDFKFWCEMCHVGTLCSEAMNSHKRGKKHVSRLRRCEQSGGTGSFNQKKSAVLVDTVEEVSENGKKR